MSEKTLAKISELNNPAEIFKKGGIDDLVSGVEREVRNVVHDISTSNGRKEIASLAYKVSKSKTILDGLGKSLVSEWKEKAKVVDADRKKMRDRLDALRDEVRQPLTDYEAEEKAREAALALAKEVNDAYGVAIEMNALHDRKAELERKQEALRLAEELRQEKLLRDAEEVARVERDERLKREAADFARAEAEQRLEDSRRQAEREIINARLSAERAEREKVEAAERDERRRVTELKQQEERIRIEHERAEASRLQAEAAEIAEQKRKAADLEHRKSVNNDILIKLMALGMTEGAAKTVISYSASGKLGRMIVNY